MTYTDLPDQVLHYTGLETAVLKVLPYAWVNKAKTFAAGATSALGTIATVLTAVNAHNDNWTLVAAIATVVLTPITTYVVPNVPTPEKVAITD